MIMNNGLLMNISCQAGSAFCGNFNNDFCFYNVKDLTSSVTNFDIYYCVSCLKRLSFIQEGSL